MKKAFGRSLDDFLPLREAEKSLLDSCAQGRLLVLSDQLPLPPLEATAHNSLRAAFVRFLALGGDGEAPVHEMGVQVQGARIEGVLDFDHCKQVNRISLEKCYFVEGRSQI